MIASLEVVSGQPNAPTAI